MLTLILLPAAVGVALVLLGIVVTRSRTRRDVDVDDDYVAPPVDLDFLRASPWQKSMNSGCPLTGRRALPVARQRGDRLRAS